MSVVRLTASYANGDHTAGAWVEVSGSPWGAKLLRILLRTSGQTLAATFGVYVAGAGKALLTSAERAAGEVYLNTGVAAAADPSPELNVVGTPIAISLAPVAGTAQSIYVYWIPNALDVATSAKADLYLDD